MPQTRAPEMSLDEASTQKFLAESRPILNQVEAFRLTQLKSYTLRKKLILPVGIAALALLGAIDYVLLKLQSGLEDSYGGVTIFGLIGLWFWLQWPNWEYKRAYKEKVLPQIVSLFGPFRYRESGKIAASAMRPSKILPEFTSYESEDHFSGRYRKVEIEFAEIELMAGRKKHQRTVFEGIAILLSRGTKTFHGHTIITKDRGRLDRWWREKTDTLKRADLADPEFEKQFDVFTTDQVEARYLIDPRIIENIKALYREHGGTQLSVAFYDQHVLILIGSSKDHFEAANIKTPAFDQANILSLRNEIAQIISIIDQLELYDRRNQRSNTVA
ncbi:MAG: DUF3137 domain-containing protein [Pseudomonadota bacterium]